MSICGWEIPTNSSKIKPPWNVMIPQSLSIYLSIYQFIFSQKHIIGNIDHTPSHWASLFSWIIYALNFHHLFHAVFLQFVPWSKFYSMMWLSTSPWTDAFNYNMNFNFMFWKLKSFTFTKGGMNIIDTCIIFED